MKIIISNLKKRRLVLCRKLFLKLGFLMSISARHFLEKQNILNLDYALFAKDAITLDKLASRSVSLKSHKHDKGLRLDFEIFQI